MTTSYPHSEKGFGRSVMTAETLPTGQLFAKNVRDIQHEEYCLQPGLGASL
jgi:hypothetical protein